MNTRTHSAECLQGMHEACVTENACACECHREELYRDMGGLDDYDDDGWEDDGPSEDDPPEG